MKNIEVEMRGMISREKIAEIEKIFLKKGKFKNEKNRVLIDYSMCLPCKGISDRNRDIRLRATNGIPEIILKIGKWGGVENRREISILTNPGEFDKLVEIFAVLGFKKGYLCIRRGKIYDYKGVEFSLVEVPGHSYYFEAEKLISNNKYKEKAKKEIKEICGELGLKLFDDKSFYAYIETLNREANEIFDFNNYKENYFKKRFNL